MTQPNPIHLIITMARCAQIMNDTARDMEDANSPTVLAERAKELRAGARIMKTWALERIEWEIENA
jgi:hypothetical protein